MSLNYIYLIQENETAFKVGVSKKPVNRLSELKVGSTQDLQLVGYAPGDTELEKEIHRKFANSHLRGEWFSFNPELRDYISNLDDFVVFEQSKAKGFKGGRGKRAPYETVMYRIPVPIKPLVELIGHTYRLLVDGVADPNGEQLIRRVEDAVYATGYEPQSDPEDFDPDIDDQSEPTDSEVIKTQVKMIERLTTEVKVLERELAEDQERRTQQELEINQLRSQLEKIKASEKDALDQLCSCHSDAFEAAGILKAALKLKSNAGGAIKREIEKALPLIDDM